MDEQNHWDEMQKVMQELSKIFKGLSYQSIPSSGFTAEQCLIRGPVIVMRELVEACYKGAFPPVPQWQGIPAPNVAASDKTASPVLTPKPPLQTALQPVKHSHYFRPCPYDAIDVYRVLEIFDVKDPVLQHVVKKALVAGGRGHKNIDKDIQDCIDSLERWKAMRVEEGKLKITMSDTYGRFGQEA